MGSGKSETAKLLANRLNVQHIDLDQYIEQKAGKIVEEIFQKSGELGFRKLERTCLHEIAALEQAMVLSCGGGTPVYYDNMNHINAHFTSFFLQVAPNVLAERIALDSTPRPVIERIPEDQRIEFIAKHLFERNAFYEKADHTIFCKNLGVAQIVHEIVSRLNSPQNHQSLT